MTDVNLLPSAAAAAAMLCCPQPPKTCADVTFECPLGNVPIDDPSATEVPERGDATELCCRVRGAAAAAAAYTCHQ
jgi:hypothetical protein